MFSSQFLTFGFFILNGQVSGLFTCQVRLSLRLIQLKQLLVPLEMSCRTEPSVTCVNKKSKHNAMVVHRIGFKITGKDEIDRKDGEESKRTMPIPPTPNEHVETRRWP